MEEDRLREAEARVRRVYLTGRIRGAIHLSSGNESHLVRIFASIQKNDWVFSTHRSHFHALLKGMSEKELLDECLAKRSMHLNSKRLRFFTSSIVGGCLPIALGVALGLHRGRSNQKVWVFVGDMAAEMGVFDECVKYAARNDLPIIFVVEDNGLSTYSPTQIVWGLHRKRANIHRYSYERDCPHAGVGEWVEFD